MVAFCAIPFFTVHAQAEGRQIPPELTDGVQIETHSKLYNAAFLEMSDMLDGKTELSVKRAEFLLEWAYLDGKLDYKEFCHAIDTTVWHINLFIKANHLDQYKTGGNYALFEYFSSPYSMNGRKPFTYDYEDFAGSEDLTKLFITKVMRTHSGQCRSLPVYYKVLAEAIGAEAHITLAPQHSFIRHHDEKDPNKWVNVELTTLSLSRDIVYLENFGISDEAIRNKVFMYPLSDKETVAYLLSELLVSGYLRKYNNDYDDFVWLCSQKTLEYYPQDVIALRNKGNVLTVRLMGHLKQNGNVMDDVAKWLDQAWKENNETINKLGYTEMPDDLYLKHLNDAKEEMKKAGFNTSDVETEIKQAETKQKEKK